MDRDGGELEDRFVLAILRSRPLKVDGSKIKFGPSLLNAVHSGQPLTGRLVVLVPGSVDELFSYLVDVQYHFDGKPGTG